MVLAEQRRLDLDERVLFAKLPSPELLAALRAGKGLENKDKLERISLAGRSLRRAQMRSALLVGADLREAQLQGASLWSAQLQGADLSWAQLQGAKLWLTQLQGANLRGAQLQGADLFAARLQGADLGGAQLQGADLRYSRLYRNGDPALSDLLNMHGTVVEPLSPKEFAEIPVSYTHLTLPTSDLV